MSISFEKHRSEIVAAWKDVLDDKSTTNWSLYSYEGQTNEMKVMGSGEGGLEELCDDLNSSKIMYAFVRIEDPTTGLKKFLLINWQGEGAPVLRKGTCANHIHDVAKLLSGAHLTMNARNEDDIDSERLLKKLSAVSSAYSFKEPRSVTGDEPKTPVGTNYTRVIPTKELNASVMQDFWRKEEAEEKKRLAAEKEAKRSELAKLEQEQRTREEKEHQKREQLVVSGSGGSSGGGGGGNKLQSAHVPIKTSPQPLSPEKTAAAFNSGLTEADRMRQLRNQEAKELIGSRVGAAKAIFTRNTSEGQLQSKLNTAPPAKPARTSIAQRIHAFNQQDTEATTPPPPMKTPSPTPGKIQLPKEIPQPPQQQEVVVVKENPIKEIIKEEEVQEEPVKPEITAIANNDDPFQSGGGGDNNYTAIEPEEQYSTIKRSPHSKSNSLQSPDETSVSNATDSTVLRDQEAEAEENNDEEIVCPKISVTVQQSQSSKNGNITALDRNELNDLVNEDDFICQDSWGDLGLRATALYDYQAADESEISFDPGDVITHIDQIDEGWWQGLGPDGTYGLFPANYVEILK